jgi:NAD(P)-dependent dehydrogenase (short-subunit alcohol dehydrogenase family)
MNNLSLSQGPLSLSGKTAVITGAGAGIGQAIAELFAQAGAKVVVADVNAEGAERVAAGIREAGGQALAAVADVSQDTQVAAMLDQAIAGFGTLDILVNNAAIFPKKPFLEVQTEFWDKLQSVNLRGTFLCLREAIARMQAQGTGGSIVNISSVSSMQAVVYHNATYNASKAGVNSLTKTTALEFGADRIRVNAVLPGGIPTPGAKAASAAIQLKGPILGPDRIPLGGMGDPSDIAMATLFLASPAARYITGQLLAVDGGFQVS